MTTRIGLIGVGGAGAASAAGPQWFVDLGVVAYEPDMDYDGVLRAVDEAVHKAGSCTW